MARVPRDCAEFSDASADAATRFLTFHSVPGRVMPDLSVVRFVTVHPVRKAWLAGVSCTAAAVAARAWAGPACPSYNGGIGATKTRRRHAVREGGDAGRFPRERAGGAEVLGAARHLRGAAAEEPRPAEVVVPRRADHRQQ